MLEASSGSFLLRTSPSDLAKHEAHDDGGPLEGHYSRRECTDAGCAVFLASFLFGLLVIYLNSRGEGNLAKLTHGFDWEGKICGVDQGVEDRPWLFWCHPGQANGLQLLDGVCVQDCPRGQDTDNWCPGVPQSFETQTPRADGSREVIIGMARNLTLKQDYPTLQALGYCFPHEDVVMMQRIMEGTHVSTMTKQVYLACHGALDNWRFLIAVALLCICIGYMFLFVLWSCFARLIYTLVASAHLLLCICFSICVYAGMHEDHNFFANYANSHTSQLLAWSCAALTLGIWVLFGIVCYHGGSVAGVAVESVQSSCEIIAQIPSMLLQPLVHSLFVLIALLLLIYGFAWLLSTGRIVPDDQPLRQGGFEISGFHRSIEFTSGQWACIAYWVFGTVWIFETLNALGQFAISHAVVLFACFRARENFPMVHGYVSGLAFHLGTLAYGGFVIGCLKIVAAFLAFLARQSLDHDGAQSMLGQVLCCCCAQCVVCIERVLTMVNDLVYTDVALRAVGYADAAANVVRVAASNPGTYLAIKGSATAVRVLGVTSIGGVGTFLSYQVLSSSLIHRQLDAVFVNTSSIMVTSNIMGTTIAAGLICFYIAMAFMMVFYQTTYTLMYCMLIGVITVDSEDSILPSRMVLMQTLKKRVDNEDKM